MVDILPVTTHVATGQVTTEPSAVPTVVIDGEKVRRQQSKDGKLGWRLRVYDPLSGRQPEERFWGTERQATRRIDEMIAEVRARTTPTTAHADAAEFGAWFDHWITHVYVWETKPRGNTPGVRRPYSTWKNAKSAGDIYLKPAIGVKAKMRLITTETLEEAIGSLTRKDGQPLATTSKESMAIIAKMIFRDAVKAGVIGASPAANLSTKWGRPDTSRTALIPSLTDTETMAAAMDQVWRLPRWCRDLAGPNGEGYGDIVRLMTYTGLRISELFALHVISWDRKRMKLYVRATVTESGGRREYRIGRGKSKAAIREVVVLPQAVPALERWLAIAKRGRQLEAGRAARRAARNSKRTPNRPHNELWTLVINGEYGGFMSYGHWRKKLASAQELSGVGYTAHELRYVFASLLYAAGENEAVIAYQMGHSTPDVARRIYRHMFNLSHAEMSKRVGAKAQAITAEERARAEAELQAEGAPLYRPEDNE